MLTTCPDCKRDISTEAPACPHCGRPMAPGQVETEQTSFWRRNRGCGDLLIYSILAFLLFLVMLRRCR